ncbi:POL1 protein, partial [Nothoprocta pentlandii]|nr:POL1 protein [Nothoprocta pentlandii]
PNIRIRVLPSLEPGPTYFTDASSRTSTAAVIWKQQGKWQKLTFTQEGLSVQYLEAKAVSLALQMRTTQHINIVTDSIFVWKLVQKMTCPGYAGSEIACLLEDALQQRQSTCSVMHVNSHQHYPGLFAEGNGMADKAANKVWTLNEAREAHDFLHLGAKALAKHCGIPISQARKVVATCPYCQR